MGVFGRGGGEGNAMFLEASTDKFSSDKGHLFNFRFGFKLNALCWIPQSIRHHEPVQS